MGLSGNMTSGEILEQVVHADRILGDEYRELQRNHTGDTPLPKIELVRNIVRAVKFWNNLLGVLFGESFSNLL